jgi:hypothetical protein
VGDPAVSGVVSVLPIFASLTSLMISPEKEYPIVRSRRDRKGYQDIGSKRRKANNLLMAEKCDDPARRRQSDPNHRQKENYGGDRPIHKKQHNKYHCDSCHCDFDDCSVAAVGQIRYQWGRTGYIGFDPIWRWRSLHNLPDGADGFVPQRLGSLSSHALSCPRRCPRS